MASVKKLSLQDLTFLHETILSDKPLPESWTIFKEEVSLSLVLLHTWTNDVKIKPEIGTCSVDRDKLLLMLTILNSLLDRMISNDECPYHVVCGREFQMDMNKLLMKILSIDVDAYISYMSVKCLYHIYMLLILKSKEQVSTTIRELLNVCLKSSPKVASPVLDLFRLVFSRKRSQEEEQADNELCMEQLQELRMLSFTFLSSNWMQLQGRFVKEQILMAPSGETAQFGFLSLWLKLIKFINTHQQRVENPIPLQSVIKLPDYLLSMSDTSTKLPTVCWNKALDILSQSLPYGDMVSPSANVFSPQMLDLAVLMLNHIQTRAFLEKVPLRRAYSYGFGGLQSVDELSASKASNQNIMDKGSLGGNGGVYEVDMKSVRKAVLVALKASAVQLKHVTQGHNMCTGVESTLETVLKWIETLDQRHSDSPWLIDIFTDQDDSLVEAMLCALDIYLFMTRDIKDIGKNLDKLSDVLRSVDPHTLYLGFLDSTAWDHSILLDLLTSPETCFLLYMVRYLRYVVSDWDHLQTVCQIHHADNQTPLSLDAPVNLRDPVKESAPDINITQPLVRDGPAPVKPSDFSVPVCKVSDAGDDEAGKNDRLGLNPPQFRISVPGQESGGLAPKLSVTSEPPSPKPVNKQLSALVMTKEFKRDICGGSRSPSDEQGSMLGVSLGMQCVGHNASSLSLLVQYSSSEDELDLDDDIDNLDLHENMENVSEERSAIPDKEIQHFSISGEKCNKWVDETDSIYAAIAAKKHEDSVIDRFMTVLIRLRLAIGRLVSRGLFPYNAEPLVKLLEQCEQLYET